MRRPPLTALLWLALVGCGGANAANPAPMSQGTIAGGAAVTAAAAGVIWAAGGGCKIQGCPYGSYCNRKTGFCDVAKCSEGCPQGTVCNEGLGRCQAPPPPSTPNDFQPEDNVRLRPPGTQ